MKVVCCPDSLKGVLGAGEAAAALAEGAGAAGAKAVQVPLADGGEGTAEVLHRALGGEWRSAKVLDALGRPVTARFLLRPDGGAIVEAAEAIGLARLGASELDPLGATSRGLGALLLAAVDAGASHAVVALGGSATTDGGAGLRQVIDELPFPVTAACDVSNPLLGPRGAARVFGPQKGASPEQVDELERRLEEMPELTPFRELPGAGAAGGLGAAFAALGAELVRGIDLVLEAVGFDEIVAGGALAVTGEGAVDASSAEGKVPAGVVAACARARVPCVVFGGRVEPAGASALIAAGAAEVTALSGDPQRALQDLRELGEQLARRVVV